MKTRHSTQIIIVGIEALGRLPLRPFALGLFQLRCNRTHSTRGYLILKVEDIFQPTLKAVRPKMHSRGSINELPRYAHAVCRLPHAPFEDIAHAQLAPDLLNVPRSP